MILIADSGSTKCDWALLGDDGVVQKEFSTKGMNPFFFDAEAVEAELRNHERILDISSSIVGVYFYGSGCSTEPLCDIIKNGLVRVFQNAKVNVAHDMLGAAYSTYDGRPAITAILGTGSNSCYFDGTNLEDTINNLAFILGDEASGNYFGKQLLRDYFYNKLPSDLHEKFAKKYNLSKDELLENVYRNPYANTWLAGFMKFFGENHDHPYVQREVQKGMQEFVDIHVKGIPQWKSVPLHCIGSISHYFKDCLQKVCDANEIELGNIIKKPIDGLVQYHLKFKKDEIFG